MAVTPFHVRPSSLHGGREPEASDNGTAGPVGRDRSGGERLPASDPEPRAAVGSPVPGTPAERAALYRELEPLVRRLVRQYGDDPHLRQDLEGEIFCRFCRLLEQFDSSRGIPLKAYLVSALPPAVYSYVRAQWRHQQRERCLDRTIEPFEAEHAADPTHQWIEQLEREALLRLLPSAIARLPLRQRQVVIWRYYEGLSFEGIAARVGLQPVSIRSNLRHAIQNLRRLLDEPGGAECRELERIGSATHAR